jgi:hypothetical protein
MRPAALPALPAETEAEKSQHIKKLIDSMEYISARQWSQPGGVEISADPIVQQIAQEGDDAVPPLLDVLQNDDRLTRSVGMWRNFFRFRFPVTVHHAYVSVWDKWFA